MGTSNAARGGMSHGEEGNLPKRRPISSTSTGTPFVKSSFAGHAWEVTDLKFAPDGFSFVSTSGDNTARLWTLEAEEPAHLFRVPGFYMNAAAFSPDGAKLVTSDGTTTNSVKIWSAAAGTLPSMT